IVAVDFSADWYEKQIRSQVMTTLLMSIIAIVLGVIAVLVVANRLRKRMRLLYDQLDELSDGIETLSKELSPDEERTAEQYTSSPMEQGYDPQAEIQIIGERIRSLQKRLSEQISLVRSKAYLDGLTSLENRTAYYELLERINSPVLKGEKTLCIAMFDVNGLKPVNDTYGHEKGDEMIRDAGELIKGTFTDAGRVFRIGGDEFVVVCIDLKDPIETILQRFDENIAEINKDKGDVTLSISKGYAVYDKTLDEDCESTFVRADNAMYADKNDYYASREADRRRD
nr:GGDEF domain-containing protein [Lachnospiraceae bacterium]